MNLHDMTWFRPPGQFNISEDTVDIVTDPRTDLWQRTYYGFSNDSAPVLQLTTDEQFFTFSVKTQFDSRHRFDQCGIVVYIDTGNWLKASVEYENGIYQRLGSVVTNNGWSDWASTDIDGDIHTMWYRLSRRKADFRIDVSEDGSDYHQIRICHLDAAVGAVPFGIYACSPEDSSFLAVFSDLKLGPCEWDAHDGQPPDSESE